MRHAHYSRRCAILCSTPTYPKVALDNRQLWCLVAQNGLALQWASEEMKGERELCMAAVAQNGLYLEHASQKMKGDRELCMAAVAQIGLAL